MRDATVILGVASSDSHVVANQLIAYMLRERGYDVVNLGACTPIEDFAAACAAHPRARAVLIGSLNGHAYEDLKPLKAAKARGHIPCPVIVGGNLSVGALKAPMVPGHDSTRARLHDLGVDAVLSSHEEIIPALAALAANRGDRVGAVRLAS